MLIVMGIIFIAIIGLLLLKVDKDTSDNVVHLEANDITDRVAAENEKEIRESFSEGARRYKVKSASNDTVSLIYAYVTDENMKIKFTYERKSEYLKEGYEQLPEEEQEKMWNELEKNIISPMDDEYPYLETTNGKKYKMLKNLPEPQGSTMHDMVKGIYEQFITFPITINEATDELTVVTRNEYNEIVTINLERDN